MKIRTDIVRMYKEIHGWVGIVSGLALFIAFYAGAITMFEGPIQRWASPQSPLPAAAPLSRASELVEAVIAAHPEAARSIDVHMATGPENPARVSWTVRGGDHGGAETHYAAFAPDGSLTVETRGPSPVAQFIDVLHQQVGLPFEHEIAMPIMGGIALLYFVAIVSGIVVLLPSLVSDLFAVRVGKNVKRMWLDLHNVLGLLSLPFHVIMALTAVVFAFHDQFYDLQGATFARPSEVRVEAEENPAPAAARTMLPPGELARRVEAQAPGFDVLSINYHREADGSTHTRISGHDPRYGMRAPTYGMVEADAYTGELTETDYMPGLQGGWGATVTSFFALHFGNFGGAPVRWAYFLLGMAGALLFYTGNLLWIESRRKRERRSGAVEQTRSTRILAALTVGVPLGTVAGISTTLAAAKPLSLSATEGLHSAIFYAVLLFFTAWSLLRGAPRAAIALLPVTAASMMLVPLSSAIFRGGFPVQVPVVDLTSMIGAAVVIYGWRKTRRRAASGSRDSVWKAPERVFPNDTGISHGSSQGA